MCGNWKGTSISAARHGGAWSGVGFWFVFSCGWFDGFCCNGGSSKSKFLIICISWHCALSLSFVIWQDCGLISIIDYWYIINQYLDQYLEVNYFIQYSIFRDTPKISFSDFRKSSFWNSSRNSFLDSSSWNSLSCSFWGFPNNSFCIQGILHSSIPPFTPSSILPGASFRIYLGVPLEELHAEGDFRLPVSDVSVSIISITVNLHT